MGNDCNCEHNMTNIANAVLALAIYIEDLPVESVLRAHLEYDLNDIKKTLENYGIPVL